VVTVVVLALKNPRFLILHSSHCHCRHCHLCCHFSHCHFCHAAIGKKKKESTISKTMHSKKQINPYGTKTTINEFGHNKSCNSANLNY